jgi:hypothetical protein
MDVDTGISMDVDDWINREVCELKNLRTLNVLVTTLPYWEFAN